MNNKIEELIQLFSKTRRIIKNNICLAYPKGKKFDFGNDYKEYWSYGTR